MPVKHAPLSRSSSHVPEKKRFRWGNFLPLNMSYSTMCLARQGNGSFPLQPHIPLNRHIDWRKDVALHIRLDQPV